MSFSDLFRARMHGLGETSRERNMFRKGQEFERYFENTLDREPAVIDGVETQVVFQDHSQSNNKDLSDDKYVIVPNSVEVGVGSYIEWRTEEWLVFTEEFKTIPTHQQLKIKHVNRRLKWITDRATMSICNDGKGWGAYIQNQTLYTLGVSFSGSHMPLANAKMSVYIKDTPETRAIKVGTRLFITGQVYKVEFSDYVSRVGLINWLLDEDTKNPETDNLELEIADYWTHDHPSGAQTAKDDDATKKDDKTGEESQDGDKGNDSSEESADPSEGHESSSADVQDKVAWNIEGEAKPRLGRYYVYSVKGEDGSEPTVEEWIVGDIEELPFVVLEKNERSISIQVKNDFRMVGHTATIAAKVNGEIKNIAIKVIKKFG